MKLAFVSVAAALASLASADFLLVRQRKGGTGFAQAKVGYQVYPSADVFDCRNAMHWVWPPRDNASGRKWGVRIRNGGPGDLDIEMNFGHGDLHLSLQPVRIRCADHGIAAYYESRGGLLYNLEGQSVGRCAPTDGSGFFCDSANLAWVGGSGLIDCEISGVNWTTIRDARPDNIGFAYAEVDGPE
ncbi:hypothetical protein Micbo1qcDRAFT_179381 [Microdochium bolleyi]|uniref:Uncharacterized protein n=1 Tax=Microdochium bolleyi TaxID=196109 RepID=A0A136IQE3_9PEZI|nr:hypothetical protein Micbo1qcDRAFT_179381 [Microdochium bolleyi]